MTNYICINGKKTELTEEQLRQLGINTEAPKSNLFERKHQDYYFIEYNGEVAVEPENFSVIDDELYNIANYCTDKTLMEKRALHETLCRLLWRYSMEHDGDKVDFNNIKTLKYAIFYNHQKNEFDAYSFFGTQGIGNPFFYNKEIAEAAIKEIVEPFMKEHPEFKW